MRERDGEVKFILGRKLYGLKNGFWEDDRGTLFSIDSADQISYQNEKGQWFVIRKPVSRPGQFVSKLKEELGF